jgi:hypothetical protein
MATSNGTQMGIAGIGGFLHLRASHDKRGQATSVQSQNKSRHQGYLKDMLVKKFFVKHGLNNLSPIATEKTNRTE